MKHIKEYTEFLNEAKSYRIYLDGDYDRHYTENNTSKQKAISQAKKMAKDHDGKVEVTSDEDVDDVVWTNELVNEDTITFKKHVEVNIYPDTDSDGHFPTFFKKGHTEKVKAIKDKGDRFEVHFMDGDFAMIDKDTIRIKESVNETENFSKVVRGLGSHWGDKRVKKRENKRISQSGYKAKERLDKGYPTKDYDHEFDIFKEKTWDYKIDRSKSHIIVNPETDRDAIGYGGTLTGYISRYIKRELGVKNKIDDNVIIIESTRYIKTLEVVKEGTDKQEAIEHLSELHDIVYNSEDQIDGEWSTSRWPQYKSINKLYDQTLKLMNKLVSEIDKELKNNK